MKMNKLATIYKYDNEESFFKRAANIFVTLITDSIKKREQAFVALSGGTTPIPVFKIIRDEFVDKVNWNKVSFFWVDERSVPPNHSDSNFGNARNKLLDYLPGIRTYRIKGEHPAKKAAKEYEECIEKVVPSSDGLPCFDLIWLGMGTDGHTASIFPQSTVINEQEKWVKDVWVNKHDTHRVTLTFPVINNARSRMIVIRGDSKLAIFKEIQQLEEKKYPIQYIYPSDADDYWIVGKK